MKVSTCPVCQNSFEGRKNKKYCSTFCKTSHNNEVFQKKNEALKEIIGEVKKNRLVLKKIFEIFQSTPIPIDLLRATNINMKYFTSVSKEGYYMFGEYQFRPSNDNKYYSILKK
ncbi:2-hydroxyacyl-CoA dehydratase family protein [Lacihabitans sp. CS3-21]|uniref:2-hydroxyacyl-CoA dehydratase family protein n=1 Tax=Lacihabitans sp. CS3-21 TaxID=2487332 RepID=UPI0020CD3CD9|nr:2-hydroxyacyl-CoA dehydratase family protein [Lacihabitans sp. CS3-21]MCP9745978.1 hypothetical protein [Lacihabitans sp. CS3-21]